ncbi:DUF21 domain-containing protein At4g33700-like [Xenia sp. Carnegie-2017]|uniref:DUF21 domain-containing protein At4g33700-like n=1 Tax=Xenia sp. Carnegie-2017 TaxID=2897299 RepID=UPI001F042E41|nr:DUF21 domain-containing protein At4g33700-like [Xenia sp. Carnegie-2017]
MSVENCYAHFTNEVWCNANKSIYCLKKGEHVLCNNEKFQLPESPLGYEDKMFWVYLGVYIALVLFAGLMSGLTMGLLSLDILSLKVLARGGKPDEQKHAAKIIPLVSKHHLLLVTLLLSNAVAVESMPLCLDRVSNPIIAVVVSVTAVLLFGEVLPQALCTRYGLAIGAFFSPFVRLLMLLMFIIAWPISKLLDCLLGVENATFFRRAELKELVSMHLEQTLDNEEPLTGDEVLIIKGTLDLRNKTVADSYTPLHGVFMFEINEKMTQENLDKVVQRGHSRIPLYENTRENIVGLLMSKRLIPVSPEDELCVRDLCRSRQNLLTVYTKDPLFNLLNKFQTGKSHIGIVKDAIELDDGSVLEKTVGIITLEDIIEELIQEDIYDEYDVSRLQVKVENRINKMFKGKRPKPKKQRSVDVFTDRRPFLSARDASPSDEKRPLLGRGFSVDSRNVNEDFPNSSP